MNLFYIEQCFIHLKTPAVIARKYFGDDWHFLPSHPLKTERYYLDILTHTDSIRIRPIEINSKILLYHHIYICKFIHQNKWDLPPYSPKPLPNHDIGYTYHDYIEAWYKVFLFQFPDFSHSWFIQFDKFFKGQFPTWFIRWWQVHGPIHDIMPTNVKDAIHILRPFTKLMVTNLIFPVHCISLLISGFPGY
jgi:hypothetical protein